MVRGARAGGVDACPACLSPLGASGTAVPGSTPPAAWRLVFRGTGGHLEVPPGAELRLGRDADWAPEAAGLLAGETSVSARHALVAHGEDGAASVTEVPQGATNGVRVNDRVLSPAGPSPCATATRCGWAPGSPSGCAAPAGPEAPVPPADRPRGHGRLTPPRARPRAGCP